MNARGLSWPVGFSAALAAQRLATLGFVIGLGRIAGVEGVGIHALFTAMSIAVGALLNAGTGDRALYRAAQARASGHGLEPDAPVAHGVFLLSAGVGFVVCAASVPWLVESRALRPFAVALVVGHFLPQAASYASSTLRGLSTPRWEAMGQLTSAAALTVAAVAASNLKEMALGFCAAGLLQLFPLLWALGEPALAPRWRGLTAALQCVRASLPYALVGWVATLLGSGHMLVVRLWADNAEVGLLRAATLAVQGGLFAAMAFGALLLHRVQAGDGLARRLMAWVGVALGGVSAALAWLTAPWVCAHFGIAPEVLKWPLRLAMLSAPATFSATAWLPLAVGLNLRRAKGALMAGLPVFFLAGAAARGHGALGAVLAMTVVHLTTAVMLGWAVFGRHAADVK